MNWTLDNTSFGGGTPFGMNRYNTGFLDPLNYYTARGNVATPVDVQVGDAAYNERVQVRYNSTTHDIFNGDVSVRSFSPSNTVAATYTVASYDDQANSVFQVNFGTANFAGAVTAVSSNVANTQLNRFQETTYNIGTTSGTITPDFNNGSIQNITLNGSITMNSLGNAVAGRSMTLIVTQDGAGNRALTSSMYFAGGSNTLSTAGGAIDIISMFYDGTRYYASLTKGYA